MPIERGYRLGLPAGNAAEQAAVGAIWRGDSAAVARASARYSPPMQLIGKLYRSEGGWKADWIFVDSGKVLSTWAATDADARRADGHRRRRRRRCADQALRQGAARAGRPGTYRVIFTGIDSSEDYIRLSGYLQKLAVVRKITPVRATPRGRWNSTWNCSPAWPACKRASPRDGVADRRRRRHLRPIRLRLMDALNGLRTRHTKSRDSCARLQWTALRRGVACWLLWLLAPILTPFVFAAMLGWLGDPLVDRLAACRSLAQHRGGRWCSR